MYGGNGISPTVVEQRQRVDARRPTVRRRTCRRRRVRSPTRTIGRPPARSTPRRRWSRLPGRSSASQVAGRRSCDSSSSTSAVPPVSRRSRSRAGITRVSFSTSRSPARSRIRAGRGRGGARGAADATVDEQAGAVARLDRRLGDAVVGQLVVEVGDLHRPEATAATWFVRDPTPGEPRRQSNRPALPAAARDGAGRCARTRRRAPPGHAACGRSSPG